MVKESMNGFRVACGFTLRRQTFVKLATFEDARLKACWIHLSLGDEEKHVPCAFAAIVRSRC